MLEGSSSNNNILLQEEFPILGGDFVHAGEVSSKVKKILKEIGVNSDCLRRMVIATYEAEMNVVIYARKGTFHLFVTPDSLRAVVEDEGPGIEDIELAMQEGYSTATENIWAMGFGAGMGLPNIKKNADYLKIDSEVGKGTRVEFFINTG